MSGTEMTVPRGPVLPTYRYKSCVALQRVAEARSAYFPETAAMIESQPLEVLVVDDNRDAADALESLLVLWGYRVRVAYGGQSGLQAAIESPPDCIFLDINMPEIDGYSVAQKLRQRPPMQGVKLVALTAYSGEEQIKKMWSVGFDYYLNKLCDVSDIRRVLEMYGKLKVTE